MKRTFFVMLFSLLAALAARADEGVDQDLVLVGSDEALLPVPVPWLPIDLDLPFFEALIPGIGFLPPFLPPFGDWIRLPSEQFPLDLLEPQESLPFPR
jgi:hypothetical protein